MDYITTKNIERIRMPVIKMITILTGTVPYAFNVQILMEIIFLHPLMILSVIVMKKNFIPSIWI